MTEKKLDQQTGNVSDQTKPRTEGSQTGELSNEQLDTVSGGILNQCLTHQIGGTGGPFGSVGQTGVAISSTSG